MRALVTGSSGFIGSHLTERLLAEGARVIAVDRRPAGPNLAGALGDTALRIVEDDLRDAQLHALLQGVDVVFHLAARPGARGGWELFDRYYADNVTGTARLLAAAAASGVRRAVVASSSSIYGAAARLPVREDDPPRPLLPYGLTKLAAEELCSGAAGSLEVVRLRYFTVYGPRQRPDMAFARFVAAALEGKPVALDGDGRQTRDLTYVGDVVAATIAAAEHGRPGGVYNVAGGSELSMLDAVAIVERLLGTEVAVDHRPAPVADPRRTAADTTLARAELGYRPATGPEEGLAAQLDSIVAAGAA